MKRFLRLLNLILIARLILPELPMKSAEANDFSSGLLNAVQVGSQITNQLLQTYQQNQQNQVNNQALNQSINNITVKPIPDRYFPNTCYKLPIQGPDPKAILSSCSANLNQVQEATLLNALKSNQSLYEKAMLKGQSNQTNPISSAGPNLGIQCLEENYKVLLAQLNDRKNRLNILIEDLEKQDQIFKRQANIEITEMARIRAELDGENSRAQPKVPNLDFEILFKGEPSCQVALPKNIFYVSNGKKLGLKGIEQQSEVNLPAATRVLNESESWKNQITKRAETFEKLIRGKGLDAFINGSVQSSPSLSSPGLVQFAGITSIVNSKRDEADIEIKKLRAQIDSAVQKNGIPAPNIPSFGPNFQKDIADQIKVYERTVKDAHLSGCIQTRTGGGISSLIGALKQKNFEKRKTTASLDLFKRKLTLIYSNNNLSIMEKIAQIEQLEKKSNSTFNNSGNLASFYLFFNDGRSMNLTGLLKETINDCQTIQTKITRLGQSTTVNNDVQLITKYMKDMMVAENNVSAKISSEIRSRLIDCVGVDFERSAESASSGGSSCDAQKLNPSGANFCISQSRECASHVDRCRKFAQQQVKVREAQLQAKANNFNSVIDAYKNQQNNTLAEIKSQFLEQNELISKAFPGIKVDIPESLFVSLPEIKNNDLLNVGLVGVDASGNIQEMLAELKAQVSKVKNSLDQQAQEVNSTVESYIADVASNYNVEVKRWEKLAEDCQNQIQTQRQQILAKYQEDQKQQQEQLNKISIFCKNLLRFRTGPGCAEAASELASKAEELAQFLYPGVGAQLERYQDVCSRISNQDKDTEVDEDSDLNENGDRHLLLQLCDGEDQGMVSTLSSYAESQMDKISFAVNRSLQFDFEEENSSDLSRTREERLSYLYGKDEETSRSVSSTDSVSTQDIFDYLNGKSSPLTSQEGKVKNTTEGQLIYTIRKLSKALQNDNDLKDGKACDKIRAAAGPTERSVRETGASGTVTTASVSDADMKRKIDASTEPAVKKLRELTKAILRVQKQFKKKVSSGRTIAQQSGERVFNRCSSQYTGGRDSASDAILQGAQQGIQDASRNLPGLIK